MDRSRSRRPSEEKWLHYADPALASMCRSATGSYMPITDWPQCADHAVAPLCRSSTGSNVPVGDNVCFNRTLADHIGRIAPARARVSSFHELCVEHWRRTQGEPDFTAEGIFQAVVECYGNDAQDFEAIARSAHEDCDSDQDQNA